MEVTALYASVTVLVALSIASERLVEITKGAIPALNTPSDDENKKIVRNGDVAEGGPSIEHALSELKPEAQ